MKSIIRIYYILALIAIINISSYAVTHSFPFHTTQLIGWSENGDLIALNEAFGYGGGLRKLPQNWIINFVVVMELSDTTKKHIFQIKKEGSFENMKDEILKLYESGKTFEEWTTFNKRYNFARKNANPVSPSKKWKLSIKLDGSEAWLQITPDTTTLYGDPPNRKTMDISARRLAGVDTTLSNIGVDYKVCGKVFGVEDIYRWHTLISVEGYGRSVLLSKEDIVSGTVGGTLFTFWAPNEKSVAIVRASGGDVKVLDVLFGILPQSESAIGKLIKLFSSNLIFPIGTIFILLGFIIFLRFVKPGKAF